MTQHTPRIVSLIPSATEIVCALGFRDHLAGRSHECDYPGGLSALPVLTHPKVNPNAPSAQIDRDVRNLVENALSVYEVNAPGLKQVSPDVIVTQTQCEVCAVSQKDVEGALADWTDAAARIVSLEATDLDGLWSDIRRVAAALDAGDKAEQIISALTGRCTAIAATASTLRPKPRVAMIEWIDPLMAAGNWIPTLVDMAGGDNLFGESGAHSPWLDWDVLRDADPDIMVVIPCGYDIARARQDLDLLVAKPDWKNLAAVKTGQVFIADGNQYFNRPGPRLVESLEILAEILHPDTFLFGHEGTGWVKALR